MKKALPISLLFVNLVFISCKQLKVSEEEEAAMKEIAELYGGTCTYTINWKVSTKSGKTNSFEMEVSNSDFLNENIKLTEMFASNIAYVFFTHVKGQKQKYNSVKSSIVYKDGGKASFDYTLDTLQIVDTKMAYVKKVISVLSDSGIEKVNQMIKRGIFKNDEDQRDYFNKLKSVDSTFGKVIDFTPAGFQFTKNKNGMQLLHISGNLKRSKQDSQFGIFINPGIGEDEMYVFGYDY